MTGVTVSVDASCGTSHLLMAKTSVTLLHEICTSPSEQAWQRLVQIYGGLFRGWLISQGVRPSDCDDLVQEILMVMMQKLPGFEHNGRSGAFRSWARQIALNCIRESWRAKNRSVAATNDSEFLDSLFDLEDPSSELSREWDRKHDRAVIETLFDLVEAETDPRSWQAFFASRDRRGTRT